MRGSVLRWVPIYKYLGLLHDDRLDWSESIDSLYRKRESRLYFLGRLGSFNICQKLLLKNIWYMWRMLLVAFLYSVIVYKTYYLQNQILKTHSARDVPYCSHQGVSSGKSLHLQSALERPWLVVFRRAPGILLGIWPVTLFCIYAV